MKKIRGLWIRLRCRMNGHPKTTRVQFVKHQAVYETTCGCGRYRMAIVRNRSHNSRKNARQLRRVHHGA